MKHVWMFIASCGLYAVTATGCVTATDAITRQLEIDSCVQAATLNKIDSSSCYYKQ